MRRSYLFLVIAVVLAQAQASGSREVDACRSFLRHGKRAESKACFARLTAGQSAFDRAEGFWGLGRFDEARQEFALAYKAQPTSPEVRSEWGNLFLERFNPTEAANLFNEALKLDENYAPAYLGMARVAAEGYSKKAVEFAHEALKRDPKYAEAQEFLAFLALEDSNQKLARTEAEQALTLSPEALDGMAVLASIDWLNDTPQSEWITKILKINPFYGQAYATGAHFLVINRRYQEGVNLYRKALDLDPGLWAARSQMGLNLMRLGSEKEAQAELTRCYEAHFRDSQTVNALRFLDTLKDYETVKAGPAELMLNKKEAALLRPYIEPELERAVTTYQKKYRIQLPGPVRLEVYPNHDDFVVRTLGLPGQGGLLGVTFGLVVAMDSPSARPAGEFNWASTMWHELSHVYVLTATSHLVPRWFTEGLAVHEEGQASPDWGDRMTPDIVSAVREKKLLPVADLDRGFIRPEYPKQVLVSYFQAGKMCDFIGKKWGDEALLGMIHSYSARKTTPEAIEENLHESAAAFDKEFSTWLAAQYETTLAHFDGWKAAMKEAQAALQAGKQADVVAKAASLRDFYPDYVGGGSAYELLAKVYLDQKDKTSAIRELEAYRDHGGDGVEPLKKLAELEQEAGRAEQARATWKKLNYIYPEDEQIHRSYGELLLSGGDPGAAVREYQAMVNLKPVNTAEAHYDLAKALRAAHRNGEAKDEVLTALEAAPGFKPAQQLLLQLSQE